MTALQTSTSPMSLSLQESNPRYKIFKNHSGKYYVKYKRFGIWWRVGEVRSYGKQYIVVGKAWHSFFEIFDHWDWQSLEEAREIVAQHKSAGFVESVHTYGKKLSK